MTLQRNISLAPYTTFHIGGPAEYFVRVSSEEALREAVQYAKQEGLAVTILGGGSNVLVGDDGVQGLVVHNQIGGITFQGEEVVAGAGVVFDELVEACVSRGLWGLENLSCIPGTVGATPIQNVGAYGVEVADVVAAVRVFDMEKEEFVSFHPSDCEFSYRHSFFKTAAGKRYVVVGVSYRLSEKAHPQLAYKDLRERFGERTDVSLAEIREAVCAIRADKFPDWRETGTAGSFFHNPVVSEEKYQELTKRYPELSGFPVSGGVKIALSWFLDKVLGLKGVTEGFVGTYEKHVLVVVNYGGASATDVAAFAADIQKQVYDEIGVSIAWEVTRIGV